MIIVQNKTKKEVVVSTTDLSYANLTGADLTIANLTGANLTGANLTDANLIGVELTGAILTGADLTGVNLTAADLTGAILTGADLTGANLTNMSSIQNCLFISANLTNVLNLPERINTKEKFIAECGAENVNAETIWIDGTSILD